MANDAKSLFKSKTLWFNLITLFLGVLQVVSGVYYIPVDILALVMGVGNMFLRFLTNKKVVV